MLMDGMRKRGFTQTGRVQKDGMEGDLADKGCRGREKRNMGEVNNR